MHRTLYLNMSGNMLPQEIHTFIPLKGVVVQSRSKVTLVCGNFVWFRLALKNPRGAKIAMEANVLRPLKDIL